jgi:hypothetical protein
LNGQRVRGLCLSAPTRGPLAVDRLYAAIDNSASTEITRHASVGSRPNLSWTHLTFSKQGRSSAAIEHERSAPH